MERTINVKSRAQWRELRFMGLRAECHADGWVGPRAEAYARLQALRETWEADARGLFRDGEGA